MGRGEARGPLDLAVTDLSQIGGPPCAPDSVKVNVCNKVCRVCGG